MIFILQRGKYLSPEDPEFDRECEEEDEDNRQGEIDGT